MNSPCCSTVTTVLQCMNRIKMSQYYNFNNRSLVHEQ